MDKNQLYSLLGSGIAGLLNIGSTSLGNYQQSRMQDKQNQFNAQQAALNRQFQSQEAEIARDWQEQQYNQYSSPQAMVRQYQEAGLNPALMYGQNLQSSTGSSPSPSGSAASGSTPSAFMADMSGVIQSFLGLAKLKQDINESKSRELANNAAAYASERAGLASNANVLKTYSDIDVNKQSIKESEQRISRSIEEVKSEPLKRALIVMQIILASKDSELKEGQTLSLKYDNLKKEFYEKFKNKFGYYPSDNLYESAHGILGEAVRNIEVGVDKSVNFVKKGFKSIKNFFGYE